MTFATSRSILERLTEVLPALALGGATAFAVAPGFGLIAALVGGVIMAGAAAMLLARIDRGGARSAERFVVVAFPGDDEAAGEDDALLLDDPLPALDRESRVVRLFAVDPGAADERPAPIAAPGEMVARIADFLGTGRAPRVAAGADDANAALHAALADIRRSLRHG